MAKVSKAVKKYVKHALDANEEDKVYDTNQLNPSGVAGEVNNSVGSFANLTGMAQGTTNLTRIGNKVNPKSLKVWVQGTIGTTAVTSNTTVRTIIFMDHDIEAVQPVLAGVLNNTGGNASNAVIWPYNDDNVPKRFTIMLDKTHRLAIGGNERFSFSHTFGKKQLRQITFATNGGIIGKGTVRSLILSQIADNSADTPEVGICSKLYYEDA